MNIYPDRPPAPGPRTEQPAILDTLSAIIESTGRSPHVVALADYYTEEDFRKIYGSNEDWLKHKADLGSDVHDLVTNHASAAVVTVHAEHYFHWLGTAGREHNPDSFNFYVHTMSESPMDVTLHGGNTLPHFAYANDLGSGGLWVFHLRQPFMLVLMEPGSLILDETGGQRASVTPWPVEKSAELSQHAPLLDRMVNYGFDQAEHSAVQLAAMDRQYSLNFNPDLPLPKTAMFGNADGPELKELVLSTDGCLAVGVLRSDAVKLSKVFWVQAPETDEQRVEVIRAMTDFAKEAL